MSKEVMKMALEALDAMMEEFRGYDLPYGSVAYVKAKDARISLHQNIAEAEKQKPIAHFGSAYVNENERFYEAGYTSGFMDASVKMNELSKTKCNPHPKAPHGFVRNASHSEDRYVCECRSWDPYEAGFQAGYNKACMEFEGVDTDD